MLSFLPRRCRWMGPAAGLALFALASGCQPEVQRSPEAVSLPQGDDQDTASAEGGPHWPGFRGRNATGISGDRGVPIQLDPAQGCRLRLKVPGQGNSSPVVWEDLILVTSAAATSPPRVSLLAYDRRDGRPRFAADAGTCRGASHAKNGFASATPATDGRWIVGVFGDSGLAAFDTSGQRRWRADLGAQEHVWGTASSPLIFGPLVIQLVDCQRGSYLAAFRIDSGDLVWKTPRESHGCWSTPVLVEVETDGVRRTELVVNGTGTDDAGGGWVIGYDPADGRQRWRVQGTTDVVCPTPLASGELVYCASGRNGPILCIHAGGAGDVTRSRVIWKRPSGGAYVPSGVVYRNRLYSVSDGGLLTALNAGDGQPIWQHRLAGHFTASLVAADGRVYACAEEGTIYVVEAADEFRLLAANPLGEPILATPAIADGELIVRTHEHLYVFPRQPAPTPIPRPAAEGALAVTPVGDARARVGAPAVDAAAARPGAIREAGPAAGPRRIRTPARVDAQAASIRELDPGEPLFLTTSQRPQRAPAGAPTGRDPSAQPRESE